MRHHYVSVQHHKDLIYCLRRYSTVQKKVTNRDKRCSLTFDWYCNLLLGAKERVDRGSFIDGLLTFILFLNICI